MKSTHNPSPLTLVTVENIATMDFKKLSAEYEQKIVALEICLREMFQSGNADPKDYKSRLESVRKTREVLSAIRRSAKAVGYAEKDQREAGLPLTGPYTREQWSICDHYLEEKQKCIRAINKDLDKIIGWCQKALRGSLGIWQLTLTLSSLRRMIQRLDSRKRVVDFDNDKIDRMVTSGLHQTGHYVDPKRRHQTIESLIRLFQNLEAMSQRVAKKKARLSEKKAKILAKQEHLQTRMEKLKSLQPSFLPPTPLTTQKARDRVNVNSHEIHCNTFLDSGTWEKDHHTYY